MVLSLQSPAEWETFFQIIDICGSSYVKKQIVHPRSYSFGLDIALADTPVLTVCIFATKNDGN